MKPPYDPDHVEAVATVDSRSTSVRATCTHGTTKAALGPPRRLGTPGVCQDLIADFNAHRATYVAAVPA